MGEAVAALKSRERRTSAKVSFPAGPRGVVAPRIDSIAPSPVGLVVSGMLRNSVSDSFDCRGGEADWIVEDGIVVVVKLFRAITIPCVVLRRVTVFEWSP